MSSQVDLCIWHLTLRGHIDLDMSSVEICAFMRCTCMLKYKVSFSTDSKVRFIWPLTFRDYLDLDMFKMCSLKKDTCIKNIKSLSLLDPKLWPKLQIWPLTLKNDLDLIMLPLETCGFISSICRLNINCLSLCDQKLWPFTVRVTLTFTWHTTQCVALWDSHACQLLCLYLFWFKSYGYLSFDLERWPWP